MDDNRVAESGMDFPPDAVAAWLAVAVRFIEAGGVGCPECRDGLPSDAAKRGHDRHPKDCKGALERVFAARDMHTFLTQPAECWYTPAPAVPVAPPEAPEDAR